MRRWIRRTGAGILSPGLVTLVMLAILTARTKLPGEKMTPAGIRQSTSEVRESCAGISAVPTLCARLDLCGA
jgi:hypothetical protein